MNAPPDDTLRALRRGDLAGARELRLPAGLTEFPREILGLADTLEHLEFGPGTFALPDDFDRLQALRVLFCSGSRFPRLPSVLGECRALSQLGFRGCGLEVVPGDSLPPSLRWLTLTDNRIATLPRSIGERPRLLKLMLTGNRLTELPDSMADAANLELLRLSSNRLARLPSWLTALPRLAWLSYSGNPAEPERGSVERASIAWSDLAIGRLLGEGSSGRVHRAEWRSGDGRQAVAVKLFKTAVTSDGLPEREQQACLVAGSHPALSGALGSLYGHPAGTPGLVLRLAPEDWRILAGPPSLATCSRDVYDPALRLTSNDVLRLSRAVVGGLAHLHGLRLLHGDAYAHNILWDGSEGAAMLGDFGASSMLPENDEGLALAAIEVRAFGILLGELLERTEASPDGLRSLRDACTGPVPRARPTMAEVCRELELFAPTA